MIVPLKKATVFVLESDRRAALDELKIMGIMHVDAEKRESEDLDRLKKEKEIFERALLALPKVKKEPKEKTVWDYQAALELAREAGATKEAFERCLEEKRQLEAELERSKPWGEIDPERIAQLAAAGIHISLLELSKKEYEALPQSVYVCARVKAKGGIHAVLAATEPDTVYPVKPVRFPAASTARLRALRENKKLEAQNLVKKLKSFLPAKAAFLRAQELNLENTEYESVRLSMDPHQPVLALTGYVPETEVEILKLAAEKHGWGLAVREPASDEDVPTLVRRPKPLRLIKPVFDFLGTVPGYREYDVSFPFLVFFSIFFAMLIGDAGYGALFLVFSVVGRLAVKKMPAALFGLLLVTGSATVIWGVLTGTYFGSAFFAELPVLRDLIIPEIATFSQTDNRELMMLICFIIGLVHLTLAHLISLIRNWKAFKGLAEIGRLALLWGMFLMVLNLVLQEPFQPVAVYLIGGGLMLIILFESQSKSPDKRVSRIILNFLKGTGKGLANLFLTALSAVSALADIISYVRLFAVGLAGVEIAKTFNGMAASMGGGVGVAGIIISVLILFIGHALNMILSLMSVLVHGIRLNMLEFSGHLGMEWSGRPFEPFAARNVTGGKD